MFTRNSRVVPTLLFRVTPTFTNLANVLFVPPVVLRTVRVRVLIRRVVVTPAPWKMVPCRSLPTTVLLLLEVPMEPMLKEMTLMLCRPVYPLESILPSVLVTLTARLGSVSQ